MWLDWVEGTDLEEKSVHEVSALYAYTDSKACS